MLLLNANDNFYFQTLFLPRYECLSLKVWGFYETGESITQWELIVNEDSENLRWNQIVTFTKQQTRWYLKCKLPLLLVKSLLNCSETTQEQQTRWYLKCKLPSSQISSKLLRNRPRNTGKKTAHYFVNDHVIAETVFASSVLWISWKSFMNANQMGALKLPTGQNLILFFCYLSS